MKTLYDSREWLDNIRDDEVYEAYREWCLDNGLYTSETIPSKDSDEFLHWCVDDCTERFDDEMDNIRYSDVNEGPWAITGTVGCWNGRFEINPVVENSLDKAIRRCLQDDVKITYDRKAVYVDASHHDGTNSFVIRRLSDRFKRLFEERPDSFFRSLAAERVSFAPIPEYIY